MILLVYIRLLHLKNDLIVIKNVLIYNNDNHLDLNLILFAYGFLLFYNLLFLFVKIIHNNNDMLHSLDNNLMIVHNFHLLHQLDPFFHTLELNNDEAMLMSLDLSYDVELVMNDTINNLLLILLDLFHFV